ncbi:putative Metallo-hydrolase/oxidoreductase [Vibrio nigripulchritudo SOn1]|uniref:Metallo-hydrolase/oxidoreductase n=1 Tax=Vibrio nigripulchritudo SOn1 TaxID=1238450 RepID=A0AAV2VYR9_9VIBR|nr:MBL fold metallo-hydrolase [Vibrio nigripulchritudo]CCO49843.1 putative Metallo-hydrolase/oxidoreductase [Vibrio nigripulchritudo SOn1]
MKNTLIASSILMGMMSFGAQAELEKIGDTKPLQLHVFNAGEDSFNVKSVLVTGEKEAVLIDGLFKKSDAHRLVADILDLGKDLKTVYVSHSDPDYYFGLEVIKKAFPNANIVSTQSTADAIAKKLNTKLSVWGPELGMNAPTHPVIPAVLKGDEITLEGHTLSIEGLDKEYKARSYVWIPEIKAVVGGINVVGGEHVWMADTPTPESRQVWQQALSSIKALKPSVVVPGHATEGVEFSLSSVDFTQEYLKHFEKAVKNSKDSKQVIEKMAKQYPEFGKGFTLELGSQVAMGERTW